MHAGWARICWRRPWWLRWGGCNAQLVDLLLEETQALVDDYSGSLKVLRPKIQSWIPRPHCCGRKAGGPVCGAFAVAKHCALLFVDTQALIDDCFGRSWLQASQASKPRVMLPSQCGHLADPCSRACAWATPSCHWASQMLHVMYGWLQSTRGRTRREEVRRARGTSLPR